MMESNTRTLKRYANRKLYDTHISAYVTLEEMAQVVREGNDVKVIDNTSKDDITYKTFIQLLHELERKSVGSCDVELLSKVIRSQSGTFTGYISELEQGLTGTNVEVEVNESETVTTPNVMNQPVLTPEATPSVTLQ